MLGEEGAIRSHCLTADEFQITAGRHIQTSSVRVPSLIPTPLPLLLQEIRGSMNTEVFQKHKERLGPTFPPTWCDDMERKSRQLQERLEGELNTSKANLVKEAIRAGYVELGDFFYKRGDLSAALKNYVRSRDYCASSRNVADSYV